VAWQQCVARNLALIYEASFPNIVLTPQSQQPLSLPPPPQLPLSAPLGPVLLKAAKYFLDFAAMLPVNRKCTHLWGCALGPLLGRYPAFSLLVDLSRATPASPLLRHCF